MFPMIALSLVVLYLVLDRSGVLDELADRASRRGGAKAPRPADRIEASEAGPEADRRLEVFAKFIERLESGEDEEV